MIFRACLPLSYIREFVCIMVSHIRRCCRKPFIVHERHAGGETFLYIHLMAFHKLISRLEGALEGSGSESARYNDG